MIAVLIWCCSNSAGAYVYALESVTGRWENLVSALSAGNAYWERGSITNFEPSFLKGVVLIESPIMRMFTKEHFSSIDFTPGGWTTITTDGGVCSGYGTENWGRYYNAYQVSSGTHKRFFHTDDITKQTGESTGRRFNGLEYVVNEFYAPKRLNCTTDLNYVTVTVVSTMRQTNTSLYNSSGLVGTGTDGRMDLYLTLRYKRHSILSAKFTPDNISINGVVGRPETVTAHLNVTGTEGAPVLVKWPEKPGIEYAYDNYWVKDRTSTVEIGAGGTTTDAMTMRVQSNEPVKKTINLPVELTVY